MSSKNNLKPCPFCGKKPEFISSHDICDGAFYPASTQCFECGFRILGAYRRSNYGWATEEDFAYSDQTAIDRWNTRAAAIPKPHGDLIDVSVLNHRAKFWVIDQNGRSLFEILQEFMPRANIPIVIEAEGSDE